MIDEKKIKADFTIDHDHFEAVQGAEIIRLTDGTEFVRKDVTSKIMAKYLDEENERLKTELAEVKKLLQELNYGGELKSVWKMRIERFVK